MSSRHVVLVLLLALGLVSCTDSPEPGVVGPAHPAIPSFSFGNNAHGDVVVQVKKNGTAKRYKVKVDKGSRTIALTTLNDCETQIIPDPECATYIDEEGYDSGDVLVDQQVYVGYNPPSPPAGFFCPPTTNGMKFTKRDHKFDVDGEFVRLTHQTFPPPMFAKASYRVPPGPHESTDGKMIMYSGTVRVSCNIEQYRTILPFDVQYGHIWVVGVSGDFYEKPNTGGEGGGDDWADRLEGTVDGDSMAIVDDYLEDGTCTDGWAIYVDGVRVC